MSAIVPTTTHKTKKRQRSQPNTNSISNPPKKKRRWDIKDRSYINSTAEKICQKLEFLEVAKIPVSPLKLLAVQVETLFVAWQNGALSNTYLQTTLEKFAIKMAEIEQNTLAPPGWRVRWNRYAISISFTFYFPYDIFS